MKSNETKWYYTRVWYLLKRYNLRLWMTSCEHNLDSEAYLWVPAPVRFSIFQDSRLRRKSTTGRSGREQISMTRRITILWRSLHPKALLCGAMSPWLDSFDDTHTHTSLNLAYTIYLSSEVSITIDLPCSPAGCYGKRKTMRRQPFFDQLYAVVWKMAFL